MDMKKLTILPAAALLAFGVQMASGTPASAHNRAHITLPTGECIVVGSEKSVILPDGSELDLRPDLAGDQIGASFASRGDHSRLEAFGCPD